MKLHIDRQVYYTVVNSEVPCDKGYVIMSYNAKYNYSQQTCSGEPATHSQHVFKDTSKSLSFDLSLPAAILICFSPQMIIAFMSENISSKCDKTLI